jgi:hypothetical protein
MSAEVSGVILVTAFFAIAILAGLLAVTAFRRAGAREVTHSRGQRLS